MKQELAGANELDITSVRQLVKDEYMAPVEANAQAAKQTFIQRNEEEKGQVALYNDSLAQFQPQINTEFIRESISGISENSMKQQEALTENNMAYMEYADKVFQAAEENVSALQEHIQETKESSRQGGDRRVERGKRRQGGDQWTESADTGCVFEETAVHEAGKCRVHTDIPVHRKPGEHGGCVCGEAPAGGRQRIFRDGTARGGRQSGISVDSRFCCRRRSGTDTGSAAGVEWIAPETCAISCFDSVAIYFTMIPWRNQGQRRRKNYEYQNEHRRCDRERKGDRKSCGRCDHASELSE